MEIEMSAREIAELPLETAYKIYTMLKVDEKAKELEKNYKTIRFGINIEFDIYKVFDEDFVLKRKTNQIIIEGKRIDYSEFFQEIEEREAVIKTAIANFVGKETLTTPRNE